jgi:hypothetical protein
VSGPGYAKRTVSHAWGLVRDRTAEGFQTNACHCDGQSLLGSLIATSTEKSWN